MIKLEDITGIGEVSRGVSSVVSDVSRTVDRVHTSTHERLQEANRARQIELEHAKTRADVDKANAKHASLFVAGARPACLWLAVVAGALYILMSVVWFAIVVGYPDHADNVDVAQLQAIFDALLYFAGTFALGFGTLRTVDKYGGVARDTMSQVIYKMRPSK